LGAHDLLIGFPLSEDKTSELSHDWPLKDKLGNSDPTGKTLVPLSHLLTKCQIPKLKPNYSLLMKL
jgi:hypothetical protein